MPVMFQDSLISSQGQSISPRQSRTIAASIAIQLSLAAAILAIPIFHPETLSRLESAPAMTLLQPHRIVPPPKQVQVKLATDASNAMRTPASIPIENTRVGSIRRATVPDTDGPPIFVATGTGPMSDTSLPTGFGSATATNVRVGSSNGDVDSTGKSSRLPVSSGVVTGHLIEPIKPVYPRIAIAARQSGTVVLSAIIDKSGRITALKAVSGPEMLRGAAIDAVRIARYRPFLLNGEPTEVDTTISVNFRLES